MCIASDPENGSSASRSGSSSASAAPRKVMMKIRCSTSGRTYPSRTPSWRRRPDVRGDPFAAELGDPFPEGRSVAADVDPQQFSEPTVERPTKVISSLSFWGNGAVEPTIAPIRAADLEHHPLGNAGEEVFLAREVLVECLLADPQFAGESINRDAGESLSGETSQGSSRGFSSGTCSLLIRNPIRN